MQCGFSIEFSTVLTTLKSASKISILSFVHPSKIFVWEGYIWVTTFPRLTHVGLGRDSTINSIVTVANKTVALSALGRKWNQNIDKNNR
jgi:hypothetical protein